MACHRPSVAPVGSTMTLIFPMSATGVTSSTTLAPRWRFALAWPARPR